MSEPIVDIDFSVTPANVLSITGDTITTPGKYYLVGVGLQGAGIQNMVISFRGSGTQRSFYRQGGFVNGWDIGMRSTPTGFLWTWMLEPTGQLRSFKILATTSNGATGGNNWGFHADATACTGPFDELYFNRALGSNITSGKLQLFREPLL